jgi:hypothetical protein
VAWRALLPLPFPFHASASPAVLPCVAMGRGPLSEGPLSEMRILLMAAK